MKPNDPGDRYTLKTIARIHNAFPTKFGLPRQSGINESLRSEIRFEPRYRDPAAIRELSAYSHLWLLWGCSEAWNEGLDWSPTVRPPRLGGNTRVGVFATRSPFRPNAIGLSSVRLLEVIPQTSEGNGPLIIVAGADIMSGSPIFDIKPYLPYTDIHADATGGFTETIIRKPLQVVFPPDWLQRIPAELRETLFTTLEGDPRPAYQTDPARIYGFRFDRFDVRFTVLADVLTVCEVKKIIE